MLRKAKKYCIGLLKKSRCGSLPFHNLQHTMDVYENILKIGMYENFDLEELEPLLLAALFHDTGHATVFADHEHYSAMEASNYLVSKKYPEDKINLVIDCIKATRMPQRPSSIYEKIICDADLFHLGITSYLSKNNLLRIELAKFQNMQYSDKEWNALNIAFLKRHRFYTKYGQEILDPIKMENLKELKETYGKV